MPNDVEILAAAVGFAKNRGANAVVGAEVLKGGGGGEQLDVRSGNKLFLSATRVERARVGPSIFDEDANLSTCKRVAVDDSVNFAR